MFLVNILTAFMDSALLLPFIHFFSINSCSHTTRLLIFYVIHYSILRSYQKAWHAREKLIYSHAARHLILYVIHIPFEKLSKSRRNREIQCEVLLMDEILSHLSEFSHRCGNVALEWVSTCWGRTILLWRVTGNTDAFGII